MSTNVVFKREFATSTRQLQAKQTKVWSVCLDPIDSNILLGTDVNAIVIDMKSGHILHTLTEHDGHSVYCVAYSPTGQTLVTGAADKNVVIWRRNGEGICKYSHSHGIRCIEFNPVTHDVLSMTAHDVCLWNCKQNKHIFKHNFATAAAQCLSVNWSPNGLYFVLVQQDDMASVYDKHGKHLYSLNCAPVHHNIACCKWFDDERIVVASWNRKLSFYAFECNRSGSSTKSASQIQMKHTSTTDLDFYPNAICCLQSSCLILCGLDRNLYVYTAQGTMIVKYSDAVDSSQLDYILSVSGSGRAKTFCYGTEHGNVVCNRLMFKTVHSLQDHLYAYRVSNFTDVCIENMLSGQRTIVNSEGYIKLLAVYKHRLAVMLSDKVLVYSSNEHDRNDMRYKITHRLPRKFECNLLIVSHNHLVVCRENTFKAIRFAGDTLNEWSFSAPIRYMKNISGAVDKEGMLVGLSNGEIYTVFLHCTYPFFHYRHPTVIRCVDICPSKTKLAIVDEDRKLCIYDLDAAKIVLQDTNANAVAFNNELDDIFAFTTTNKKAVIRNFKGDFEYSHKTDGFIVHFSASTVYTLLSSTNAMASFKLPQSLPLRKYMAQKYFDQAYKMACLGVSKYEWKRLGLAALQSMRFDIARKAFQKLSCCRDIIKYTEFVDAVELRYQGSNNYCNDDDMASALIAADVLVFEHAQFDAAAQIYGRYQQHHRAIEMYLDLHDWHNAKQLIEAQPHDEDHDNDKHTKKYCMNDLLLKQAKWFQTQGDDAAAADMFWSAKHFRTALDLWLGGKHYELIKPKVLSLLTLQNTASSTSATSAADRTRVSEYVAAKFKQLNDIAFVKEIYSSTQNYGKLIEIYISRHEWDEAFSIINEHKEMKKDILLPYANWLAAHDRFDEASNAFNEAGFPRRAMAMLHSMTRNSLVQAKYDDTAYYSWLLAVEYLKFADVSLFGKHCDRAKLYYAYHIIDGYLMSPFTSYDAQTLFHAARFALSLYAKTDEKKEEENHKELSIVPLLYVLAKQCIQLSAYKYARSIISKMITMRITQEWREKIELDSLRIRAQPFTDPSHLASVICPRCSTPNHCHVALSGDSQRCSHCQHPFMYCMLSFEPLPLVEFQLVDNLSHQHAMHAIQQERSADSKQLHHLYGDDDDGDDDHKNGNNVNVLNLDESDNEAGVNDARMDETQDQDNDAFYKQLMGFDDNDNKTCIILDATALQNIDRSEIFIVDHSKYSSCLTQRYYRCIVPEESQHIAQCPHCQQLFRMHRFEVVAVNNGQKCPFCRYKFDMS